MTTSSGGSVRVTRTARDGDERLAATGPVAWQASVAAAGAGVFVDPSRRFQELVGLGGAFTEAAARTWQRLGPANRERLLRAYFDPVEGHGYTLCRTHIGSCDFSDGHYSYADTADDFALASFSVARDEQAVLPFLRAARAVAGQPIRLLASPWSPPAWMKTTGRMVLGGALRAECRDAWARYFVKYVQAYRALGFPIWGVTVQNEPAATQVWESCVYTAEDERDFVRDHLGPRLHEAGLQDVRVLVWDHNRDLMVERASVIYGDPEAARYVWGLGFHWYMADKFDHAQFVHDAWPDKHLLFTEGCQEGGPHIGSWALGERYARSLIHDFNHWTEGWIDWNLLLDTTGGPNHVNNLCSAPILADVEKDELHVQSSYYYLGHFARFLRPGARRILCATTRDELEATAFRNPDGSVAVVVLNRTDQPQPFTLRCGERYAPVDLPAHAIATLQFAD